jgi:protein-disulfide isomerase
MKGRTMGRLGLLALVCSTMFSPMAVAQSAPSKQDAAPAKATAPASPATKAEKAEKAEKAAKPEKPSVASKTVKAEAVTINMPEGMSREQADAILNELKAIHQLLVAQGPLQAAAPNPANAAANTPTIAPAAAPASDKVQMKMASGWHWLGRADAPVTIVEFTDYQCPFCRKYHTETFTQLKKNYIDTGKVRFVSRDLPLSFHANAEKAAEAAWCAGEQNKYWQLRDTMIDNSSDLSPDAIVKYAQTNGLEIASFKACAQAEKYKPEVQKDIADAGTVGISATPSFVIGKTATDAIDGDRVVGAVPESVFENEIQKFLAK